MIICKCRETKYQIGITFSIAKSYNDSNHVFLTTMTLQKHLLAVAPHDGYSLKFRKTDRKTRMPEILEQKWKSLARNFIKDEIRHRCFPGNFPNILETLLSQYFSRWLLATVLKMVYDICHLLTMLIEIFRHFLIFITVSSHKNWKIICLSILGNVYVY